MICDVTGAVEFGAAVTLAAFEAGKHVVTMNAELDGTVGPLLVAPGRERPAWCSAVSTATSRESRSTCTDSSPVSV